jgi:CheY-like chemotaxis protein
MRVVAWLVSSLQGRLELPVQARGDQRVLIRIPAERIAEEESAFPAVEQSGSHLVVPPRPHTPTTTNVVQTLSRVLVVDDDAMSRWSLTGQLAIHGFVADTAPNGSAAIKCLTERGYRAVLLDLYMPDETGFAVAARIRALEGDVGRVPIVGLTLRATADEQRRCREVGIDDCVIKPVRGEELAEVLHGLPVRHEPVGPQPHAAGPSAAAEEEPPTLDTATLDRLAAIGRASGDPDLGERLVRLFDQKAPHAVAGIRAALGQNELQDAAHIARRLAESSSVIGARRMESLARAALKAADAGDAGKLAEVVEALEAAYHRVKSVLRARVGSSDVR